MSSRRSGPPPAAGNTHQTLSSEMAATQLPPLRTSESDYERYWQSSREPLTRLTAMEPHVGHQTPHIRNDWSLAGVDGLYAQQQPPRATQRAPERAPGLVPISQLLSHDSTSSSSRPLPARAGYFQPQSTPYPPPVPGPRNFPPRRHTAENYPYHDRSSEFLTHTSQYIPAHGPPTSSPSSQSSPQSAIFPTPARHSAGPTLIIQPNR